MSKLNQFKFKDLNIITGNWDEKTGLLRSIYIDVSVAHNMAVLGDFAIAYLTKSFSFVASEFRSLRDLNKIFYGGTPGQGYLFLDLPEARFSFSQQRRLAEYLYQMASDSVKVFLTTNSLFLMREFDILCAEGPGADIHYVNYYLDDDGRIYAEEGSIDNLRHLSALNEELDQSSRYICNYVTYEHSIRSRK